MPTLESGLHFFLTDTATGIKAIIDKRAYPLRAPDTATYPLIVYQRIGGDRDVTHDGNSGLADSRFQITSWSPSYRAAKLLALEIVKALNGFQGALGTTPRAAAFVDNELDLFDPKTKLYSIIVDVKFWTSEDV